MANANPGPVSSTSAPRPSVRSRRDYWRALIEECRETADLVLLLDGIELAHATRRTRFTPRPRLAGTAG